jgi:ATP-binding cassette, subfamily C, bacterial CydC
MTTPDLTHITPDNPRQTFRRLLELARPFWRSMAYSALLSIITIGMSVALMGTSAWLISKAALQLGISTLGVAPPLVRGFGVGRAVFRYLERLVSHNVTFRLLARLRVWFYERIEPLAPARLSRFRSGDLLGRVVADVEELENIFLRVIAPPIVALVVGLGLTIFMGFFDPLMAVVAGVMMLATATLLPWFAWVTGQGPGRDMIHARSELNAGLVDNIQGMTDAVAYGMEGKLMAALEAENTRLAVKERRMALLDGFGTGALTMMTHLTALAVMVVAIGRIEPILLGTMALMTIAAYEAIMPLVPAAHHLGANLAAAERLFEIVDTEPAVTEPAQPAEPPQQSVLKVDNLRFQYAPDDPPALDGLSFTLEPGRMIAIVGASGAGKSTLVNLLLRFYDYEHGTITLGGVNARDMLQNDVHQRFGVMSQRTHLFNTTIRENIRIARDNATEDDVFNAARRAQIHDFIEALPKGYMTMAGEGGAALSGGERQRVALARALLKDAPILVLDEATANLDAVTERRILQTVYAAREDRALLVITHRLTLLDKADEIIVLEGGQVAERGTHADLVAHDGIYKRMLHMQNTVLEGV